MVVTWELQRKPRDKLRSEAETEKVWRVEEQRKAYMENGWPRKSIQKETEWKNWGSGTDWVNLGHYRFSLCHSIALIKKYYFLIWIGSTFFKRTKEIQSKKKKKNSLLPYAPGTQFSSKGLIIINFLAILLDMLYVHTSKSSVSILFSPLLLPSFLHLNFLPLKISWRSFNVCT